MNQLAIFTDVSINPQLKTGIGACLVLPLQALETGPEMIDRDDISRKVSFRKFENTSSTKLEIETVLWALDKFVESAVVAPKRLVLFTDSQCIAGLTSRRGKLEASGFTGRSSGSELHHATLYRRFYELQDKYGFEIVKVTGHLRSADHDTIHRVFSIVDRSVRRELKSLMKVK